VRLDCRLRECVHVAQPSGLRGLVKALKVLFPLVKALKVLFPLVKALKVLFPREPGDTEEAHSQDDSNAVGIRTACRLGAVTCSCSVWIWK